MLNCFFLYTERVLSIVFVGDGVKGFIHEVGNFTGFVVSFIRLLDLNGFGERIVIVVCVLCGPGLLQIF